MGCVSSKEPPIEGGNLFNSVSLKSFTVQNVIGKGGFGRVQLVKHIASKNTYALKYINKEKCVERGMTKHIIRERMLLGTLKHPFIIHLAYAFQDDANLYYVLQYASGGDLRYHLSNRPKHTIDAATVKVYAAELASALSYLHSKQIIHRDLKPENLLLDENGHLLLTDFNCAVSIHERPSGKAGTTGYHAPEMLIKQVYGVSVDYWSMGVVLYECTYKHLPYRNIKEGATKIPFEDRELILSNGKYNVDSLLIDLLEKNPLRRLGSTVDVKSHSFFKDIDWQEVDLKLLRPQIIPEMFGMNYSADIMIDGVFNDDPPKYKPRKGYSESINDEMSIFDREFLDYDFELQDHLSSMPKFNDTLKEHQTKNKRNITQTRRASYSASGKNQKLDVKRKMSVVVERQPDFAVLEQISPKYPESLSSPQILGDTTQSVLSSNPNGLH